MVCGPLAVYDSAMSNVTQILGQIEAGDPRAAEQLLPLVYDELRRLAAQKILQRTNCLRSNLTAHELTVSRRRFFSFD